MKILVLSLLRIGDVLAALPAVAQLRTQHPTAKIDLLLNRSSDLLESILNNVDEVLYFERDLIQAALVEADRPLFEAYDCLRNQIEDLKARNYDVVVNLTHNRLSGWLCGLIQAPKTVGLALTGPGTVSFGSSWIKSLNVQVDIEDSFAMNHTDVFLGAVGAFTPDEDQLQGRPLDGKRREKTALNVIGDDLIRETDKGHSEVESLSKTVQLWKRAGIDVVAVQLTTSDRKKDFGDLNWYSVLSQLLNNDPKLALLILGAPFEVTRIMKFTELFSEALRNSRVLPAITSFEALPSLLDQTLCLLTGDTATKHLANCLALPVCELAVGSADPHRTGAWVNGDLILQTREGCSPCSHSEACSREKLFCSLSMDSAEVESVIRLYVESLRSGQVHGASQASDLFDAIDYRQPLRTISVFRVYRDFDVSHLIAKNRLMTEAEVFRLLERQIRVYGNERSPAVPGTGRSTRLGSHLATERVARLIQVAAHGISDTELAHLMSSVASRLDRVRQQMLILHKAYAQASRALKTIDQTGVDLVLTEIRSIKSLVNRIRPELSREGIGTVFADALSPFVDGGYSQLSHFGFVRKLKEKINDCSVRIHAIRDLCLQLEIFFLDQSDRSSDVPVTGHKPGGQE